MPEYDTPQQQDPSLRAGNRVEHIQLDIAEYTKQLIEDETLSKLEGSDRTTAIVDRVVGAVVANGTVKGSRENFKPEDILENFDASTHANLKTYMDYVDYSQTLTRTAGIRDTFALLTTNGLAHSLGSLKERAGLGEYSRGKGFASMDMVEGYLHALEERYHKANPDAVMSGIAKSRIHEAMTEFVESDYDFGKGFVAAMEDMSNSENDFLRQSGNAFSRALNEVRTYGADEQLLDTTANQLRAKKQFGEHVGSTAMKYAMTNYDRLFS